MNKKRSAMVLVFMLSTMFLSIRAQKDDHLIRYIEVTGSAELELEPDEIMLSIGIEEYLKESFDKNTQFRDYQKKASIAEIEQVLFSDLRKIGINRDQITVREVGNQWRYPQYGKDFLFSKTFDITLNDYKLVDKVIHTINSKGISSIMIKDLKNKNITEFRKKVKTEALKAAKEKATYLLQSIDKKLGPIISITEIVDDSNIWYKNDNTSNAVLPEYQSNQPDNIRNIRLRYEIKAKFEIEQ